MAIPESLKGPEGLTWDGLRALLRSAARNAILACARAEGKIRGSQGVEDVDWEIDTGRIVDDIVDWTMEGYDPEER